MNPKEIIKELRKKIDDIDDRIIDLFMNRFSHAKEIGDIKSKNKLATLDATRERDIIDRLNIEEEKLDRVDIKALYKPIFSVSRQLQEKEK